MSEHKARISWKLDGGEFLKGRFSREHSWSFDGGLEVKASPSPAVVPVPWSNPAYIDPEEAYVAALASCHMLTFLWVAYRAGVEVARYEDASVGVLTKDERGVSWVSSVVLRPQVEYRGAKVPSREEEERMHHAAHEGCFISNSVKTEIKVELAPRREE